MKLIILNGASCSGKSTIVKNIMKERDNLFYLHYDSLKWSFSKYTSGKYYQDISKIVLSVADTVFDMGYDVISDSSLYKESRDKLISLANKYDYQIIEINLEAEKDVLLKRFDERVKSALAIPEKDRRIANTSVDRFKELIDIFNKEKNPSALTFKTDIQTIDEITESVMSLLS